MLFCIAGRKQKSDLKDWVRRPRNIKHPQFTASLTCLIIHFDLKIFHDLCGMVDACSRLHICPTCAGRRSHACGPSDSSADDRLLPLQILEALRLPLCHVEGRECCTDVAIGTMGSYVETADGFHHVSPAQLLPNAEKTCSDLVHLRSSLTVIQDQ